MRGEGIRTSMQLNQNIEFLEMDNVIRLQVPTQSRLQVALNDSHFLHKCRPDTIHCMWLIFCCMYSKTLEFEDWLLLVVRFPSFSNLMKEERWINDCALETPRWESRTSEPFCTIFSRWTNTYCKSRNSRAPKSYVFLPANTWKVWIRKQNVGNFRFRYHLHPTSLAFYMISLHYLIIRFKRNTQRTSFLSENSKLKYPQKLILLNQRMLSCRYIRVSGGRHHLGLNVRLQCARMLLSVRRI